MINYNLRHRCFTFKTEGKITYDPDRGQMKANTNHWCVINIDNGIAEYCRELFFQRFGIRLLKTSWDTHLSVLKGYPETRTDIPWGQRDGETVEVNYGNEMFWKNEHVWLNAYCEAYWDLRKLYGLQNPKDQGHITIGKFRQEQMGLLEEFSRYYEDK